MTVQIRANTVLPARREPLSIRAPSDGLRLVGELALPEDRDPVATLVCLHPLPTHGGMMDSHLLRKASWRLPALAGLAVLRFNTRGTSLGRRAPPRARSTTATASAHDVEAAVDEAVRLGLPDRWLLGWSFGTDLALRWGRGPAVEGAILLSPPLRYSTDADLDAWAASGKPLLALVPELDDYLRPERGAAAVRPRPAGRGRRRRGGRAPVGGRAVRPAGSWTRWSAGSSPVRRRCRRRGRVRTGPGTT